MNRSQGGGGRVMQFGRSRHKLVSKDQPKTTFADVAGVDEAIEELEEVKEYLQNPAKFQAMGAKIPRGVLLFGPPGTGKTLLARAVAGEAGVPFFSISGSDFVEMFVGVGAARVRDLFEQAKADGARRSCSSTRSTPSAVTAAPGSAAATTSASRRSTSCSSRWTGSTSASTVILMAATNRPDILDPALLRPGRFDRQVVDRSPGPGGTQGHPEACTRAASRSTPRVDLDGARPPDARLHRRGPRERDQRGRAARRAPRQASDRR